jgi:hypothetical protein
MRQNRPVQLIKLEQSERAEETTAVAEVEQDARNSEHEIKPVVRGWVRDHEHRSEEFARAFKDLLTEEGFISSQATSRPGK